MRIKARYFQRVMLPDLQKDVDEVLRPFPDFREELFDKLYTFFRRYFTESGSMKNPDWRLVKPLVWW